MGKKGGGILEGREVSMGIGKGGIGTKRGWGLREACQGRVGSIYSLYSVYSVYRPDPAPWKLQLRLPDQSEQV